MRSEVPGAPDGRHLFVYYRVPAPDLDVCVRAARTLQAELALAQPGLCCTLLQRPAGDDPAAPRTLMETYARAGGVDAALQGWIEQRAHAALDALITGPRHVEVFEPCA